MSKQLARPPQQQSEEIDLGQLFKLIGNVFNRMFQCVAAIFRSMFTIGIHILKTIIDNLKVIALVIIVAGAIGYAIERTKPPLYASSMLVKTYFESQFQLIKNIEYYNTLISDKNYLKLGGVFGINKEVAQQILEFEIESGEETRNDKILEYEAFVKQIDSSRVRVLNIKFEDYIENRNIYSSSMYQITVKSLSKGIFKSLEKGFNLSFVNNPYTINKKNKRDALISIDKERIFNSLKDINSLKEVYIHVLKNKSSSSMTSGKVVFKEGVPVVQEGVKTKEFELLNRELKLREALTKLESKKLGQDKFFEMVTTFQEEGNLTKNLWSNTLLFPIAALCILVISYVIVKAIKFIKRYSEFNPLPKFY